VIIEKYISTRGGATRENIFSMITREPKIGILPKPTNILYFMSRSVM